MSKSEKLSAQANTASAIRTETVTGSHIFKIYDYSLSKGIGTSLQSDVFTVGGYEWTICYYPDGCNTDDKDFISFFLKLQTEGTEAKARFTLTILKQDVVTSGMRETSEIRTFKTTPGSNSRSWGYSKFIKRTKFEESEWLKDDAFSVKCTVMVIKGTHMEAIKPFGITVPPSDLKQNLTSLLESGDGADVTFVVEGERFKAHRWMLAARSTVLRAELFGGMKESWTDTIAVDDIKAPVFKSMLHFIYSDSLPDCEDSNDDGDEKQDPMLMAQHLLVAADRYELERLKLICEDLLCKNLHVSTAATTIIFAEKHNCTELKAQCLNFMSSPVVFKAVAQTEGFHDLLKICPSILRDI